jgi:hypothetical protein
MEDFSLLKDAAQRGDLYLDLVALGGFQELEQFIAEKGAYADYNGRLKLAGIKIIGDGSPQGKTAFFTEPYLTGGPAGEKDWRGEPVVPQETMDQLLETIYGAGLRAFVHANGDAAVDVLLNSHKKHAKLAGKDSRTVIIHSQFMRREQLDDYVRFGMVPSFFSNHTFFWGDVHVKNLGTQRAYFLSPMKSAGKLGIHFTNHSDYAVTPLDPLFTVWSAVNRLSRSGKVIGDIGDRRGSQLAARVRQLQEIPGVAGYHDDPRRGGGENQAPATIGVLAGELLGETASPGNPENVHPVISHLRVKTVAVSHTLLWCVQVMAGGHTPSRHHNSALSWKRPYHGNPGTIFFEWQRPMLCRLIPP